MSEGRRAPQSAPPWSFDNALRLLAHLVARAAVALASVVVACLLAVEEKPWWLWALEWVAGGFRATPRYEVDWGTLLFMVSLGIEAARRVGRRG